MIIRATGIISLPYNRKQTTRLCVYLVTLVYPVICSCDLDLDPMTLINELDIDILKMYQHTKNEVK